MSGRSTGPALIAALGFCAACAQALIVRESLSVISGTELLLGLVLASWLFWIGAGGLLGGRVRRGGLDRARRLLGPLALAAAVLVPASVLLIRLARAAGGWPLGSTVPFRWAVACCLAAPAPFAIVYGIFYNSASAAAGRRTIRRGITAAYVFEAAGSAAGALLFPLLIAALLTQAEASAAVALAPAAAWAAAARRRRTLRAAGVTAAAVAAAILMPRIDRAVTALTVPGYRIERIAPSPHGELTAVRDRGAVSIYSGSTRIATFPPTGLEEESVHVPLLAHPAPRSVLLLGGAVGGGLAEVRRHPGVERIDWLEIDPALPALATSLAGLARGGRDGDGPAVRGIEGDGRWFLARRGGSYDVIVVSAPAPTTLRWNRLFTEEFFRTARASLAPGGVLAISHPSSEHFLSDELTEALAMLERTLGAVFPCVAALPGVTARFLASPEPVDPAQLAARLEKRGLETRYLQADDLSLRSSPARLRHFREALSRARGTAVNSDSRPLLVALELALEGERTGGSLIHPRLAFVPAWLPPALAFSVLATSVLLARRAAAARAAVFCMGMCAMLTQLTAMLALQSYSGLLYHTFIVMTALFMAGAAAGAAAGRAPHNPAAIMRGALAGVTVLAAAVPLWLRAAAGGAVGPAAGMAGFLVVPALTGALTGIFYRTVVGCAYGREGGRTPAVYYAWDLFGAVAGSLIAGVVMIPVAGTVWTAAFVAAAGGLAAVALAGRAAG